MRLTLLEAHLLCLAIVSLDVLGRSLRLRWYLKGLGAELSLQHSITATAWGDAAAGLTPLRFGGEAAKFAGLVRGGVRPATTLLGLALEAVVTYPLVALFGLGLAWRFAPSWWSAAGPLIGDALRTGWPWLLGILLLAAAGGWAAVRWQRRRASGMGQSGAEARAALGRVPRWVILAGIPLSLYNIVGRTLVLPLLACTLPQHPPFGVMMLGSFALLYSQLLLPMPAGVGAVDFGFLAGVAGDLGPAPTGLLLAWRLYTVGLGALLGLGIALHTLGWGAVRRMMSRTPEGAG
jgi:uncharacterized membrane protein YbhN (UPF0104 family)